MNNIRLVLIALMLIAGIAYANPPKPVDTTITTYYGNGKVKSEYSVIDGKYDGLSKVYYEDGSLMMAINYRKGVPVDTSKFYFDGYLHDVIIYKDGVFVKREVYNNDGSVAYRTIIVDGKCVEKNAADSVIYIRDVNKDKYCM